VVYNEKLGKIQQLARTSDKEASTVLFFSISPDKFTFIKNIVNEEKLFFIKKIY